MAILPKATYRFKAIPLESQWYFLKKQNKKIIRLLWNHQRLRTDKAILRKKEKKKEKPKPEVAQNLTSDYATK